MKRVSHFLYSNDINPSVSALLHAQLNLGATHTETVLYHYSKIIFLQNQLNIDL